MKLDLYKHYLLVLGQRSDVPVSVKSCDIDVVNSSDEKLLGTQINSKLSFDKHATNLCQKASDILYALARIFPYMDGRKLKTLMKACTSQFQYCPSIWMFQSRQLNNKIKQNAGMVAKNCL